MPASPWYMFATAHEQWCNGDIDFGADSFRMVLVTSSWTPAQLTDAAWSAISANEVANGNGYTTHGQAVTVTDSTTGLAWTIDVPDQSWPSSTITAQFAVIVKDADANGALAGTDIPVLYAWLDTAGSISSTGGALDVNINASGVFTSTAATDPN